jgi:hypothetical protein
MPPSEDHGKIADTTTRLLYFSIHSRSRSVIRHLSDSSSVWISVAKATRERGALVMQWRVLPAQAGRENRPGVDAGHVAAGDGTSRLQGEDHHIHSRHLTTP